MGYLTLRECVDDLAKHGQLIVHDSPVDPHLEVAEIQRRVYASSGPAVLFTNATGSEFPLLGNLFGTIERARFIFRDTLDGVRRMIAAKIDPAGTMKSWHKNLSLPFLARRMLPKTTRRRAGVLEHSISVGQIPQVVSWPNDGGAFITLPTVYSENVDEPGAMKSNLGMYRVQLNGGKYNSDEVGLHYQIHRGIGVHHTAAIRANKAFPVNVFVGGNPAMIFAAVMPLPEGMSELTIAGLLAGQRIELSQGEHLPVYANADFCIQGKVDPQVMKPEGPFGDHLGYYSLEHPYPVLKATRVTHRTDAIWPFTVVGRPPQEDTVFGELIHDISGPVIPTVIPGVKEVHAVDAAGVHPLLLAIGSERYTPYDAEAQEPKELLTQANAILGQGQMSLAKYVLIVNGHDDPKLDIHDVQAFFAHLLQRVRWERDLHFQTQTTIDTLDYSGHGLNRGSKVVIAANGPKIRDLDPEVPKCELPGGFTDPQICFPGVLAISATPYAQLDRLTDVLDRSKWFGVPLVVVVDDAEFVAGNIGNFLWVVFTRSNPAVDITGVEAATVHKHWGCRGSLVIDARSKPHHAPPLIEDPAVSQKVDALAAKGGELAKYL